MTLTTQARAAGLEPLIVTLPLPQKALSPNASNRIPWAVKAKAIRDYRWAAKMACLSALREAGEVCAWDGAVVEAHFFFKVNRTHDNDNLNASLKAARDGLADAGLVKDDTSIRNVEPVVAVDKNDPRVELWITKGGKP
jgi:Holliday junction resolvase RusA-like endonuclease